MSELGLKPLPITTERFAPFGDVIAAPPGAGQSMNDARFERFDDLARVDVDNDNQGEAAISIARSKTPTELPYRFDLVERHPHGSQAFIPLARFSFIVVVAPPSESVDPTDLQAFVTNGTQGISYNRGVWHMPLISTDSGQSFLIVDRAPGKANCEERVFDSPVVLEAP